jgi:hypothetical protein
VNNTEMKVHQNTGSVISVSGNTDKIEVAGDTGSEFKGIALVTGVCNAKASTGATILITVNKELYAKVNTGAQVRYKGDAAIKEIQKGTGGTAKKIDD